MVLNSKVVVFCNPRVPRADYFDIAEYQRAEDCRGSPNSCFSRHGAGLKQKVLILFSRSSIIRLKMDIDDEELPPLLVDTKINSQHTEDGPRNRVPITIVTGKHTVPTYRFLAN